MPGKNVLGSSDLLAPFVELDDSSKTIALYFPEDELEAEISGYESVITGARTSVAVGVNSIPFHHLHRWEGESDVPLFRDVYYLSGELYSGALVEEGSKYLGGYTVRSPSNPSSYSVVTRDDPRNHAPPMRPLNTWYLGYCMVRKMQTVSPPVENVRCIFKHQAARDLGLTFSLLGENNRLHREVKQYISARVLEWSSRNEDDPDCRRFDSQN